MKRLAIIALASVAGLLSCGAQQEPAEPIEPAAPMEPIGVLVEGPCPVSIPEGLIEGESIKCGTVAVPEFHAQPDGKRLHLQVAVFPSIGKNPSPDPLFVATAGPGASGIETITPEVAGPLGPMLLAHRDFVLIDYRGLPLAQPNLMCPEIIDFGYRTLARALSAEDYMDGQLEAAAACRDRLRNAGVVLEAFNNVETAADVAMVMSALGYEKFNVYGTSAGTILAQHLLRDHSHRLRSVIIDSTVPAARGSVHTEAPTVAAGTLDTIVRLCEQNADCAAAYPQLRQETGSLIDRYDREPVTVEVSHPSTGEPLQLVLTGHRVAQGILMLNSQTSTVPLVPWFIHQLANGETGIVKEFLWAIGPPSGNFSWALGTSIFCMEYSDFGEEDVVYPGINPAYEKAIATQAFGARTIVKTCEMWGVEPIDPDLRRPVLSNIPVLLMASQLDSLTPPRWAKEVAATLSNAHLYEVPGYAHSPTFAGECTAAIAFQFLDDPSQAPDDSCLAELKLEFAVRD